MSEKDATAELENQIESMLNSEESNDESEVESDAVSDEESNADEANETDSDQKEEEETSEEDSDDSQDDSETDSEVEFDFHNTSTSIQKLVSNLKNLSPEERADRISKLTREKEIEAVKQAFPDALKENKEVTSNEVAELRKQIEELKQLANPEALREALEIATKLKASEGMTDTRMKDLMLQEQFGESFRDVTKDPKFITAYEKFPSLSVEERLEYACSLSPIARKLATEDEVKKQVRLKNTKTVKKGKQDNIKQSVDLKTVNSLDKFEKLLEDKFND